MRMWTYLAELCSFGDISFETLKKTAIMGEEGAIAASTATARPRNAARAAGRHACYYATAGLPGRAVVTVFGR
jgi:hypothetical protein